MDSLRQSVVGRAFVWLESLPPGVTSEMEFFMDLTMAPTAPERTASDWETDLAAFPQRG